MKSRTTVQFRKAFAGLPEQVQQQTREAYRRFRQDSGHPSLRFKKVHPELPIYSARISKNYRAIGQLDGEYSHLALGAGAPLSIPSVLKSSSISSQ